MTRPLFWLAMAAVGVLLSPKSPAQSVSALAAEVMQLAQALSESSAITNQSAALLVKFGPTGIDIAGDQAKELLAEFAADVTAGNLPEQLKGLYEDAEQAKKVVHDVNAKLPDVPDFSHLDYCAQAEASAQQIARIEATIKDLNTLTQDAQSFKTLLLSLDATSAKLETIFAKLVGLDPATQETSYGAFAEKWDFFWSPASAGSSDDPNAAFLSSSARADWDVIEKEAADKARKLRNTLEARKAFHQHFYSLAEEQCSDDRARAAAIASLGGGYPVSPPVSGTGGMDAADPCQAAGRQAAATVSSCMQQTHTSMCAEYTLTAKCYSLAAAQCGACGSCSSQLESAATQARMGAQQICAR